MQNLSLDKQIFIFINEVLNKKIFVSIVFAIVSVAVLTTGVFWPKIYESSASILWNNKDSLSPLLERGMAQTQTVAEQADIAREIILSNKLLDQLIEKAGLDVDANGQPLSERQLEIQKGSFRQSINVTNVGKRLILISYKHLDPEMAYLVVSIVSELFLQETRLVKNQSSQGAYDFIDRQVMDYKAKLDSINQRIIEFRKQNVDLDSDTRTGVNSRVNNLRNVIRETTLQLTEARVQKRSLDEQLVIERKKIEQQLQAEAKQASSVQRESAYAERLTNLQTNLDTLRLSYTEDYPDIVQLKEQIKNLKALMENEERKPADTMTEGVSQSTIEVNFVESPLYIRLSNEIANVQTLIQTLEARISDTEKRLNTELERANKVNALESQLEEMTRDLDVTQSIYDDLLTRRENARVSLNLQLENQGSTFKIQEPATIPLIPSGLRFMHFALACVPLGLLVPLGLIYVYLLLDTRIRHEDSIDSDFLDIPVIGVVEHYSTKADLKLERSQTVLATSVFVIAFLLLGAVAILKASQVLGI